MDRLFFRFVIIHAFDRKTDRETDGQTEFSSLDHVSSPCSAVKMIATSGFLTALECTKFVFGRTSSPDPAERAYSGPCTPSWFISPTSKENEGDERAGEEKGVEGDAPSPTQIPGSAPGRQHKLQKGYCGRDSRSNFGLLHRRKIQ